jgi:transcriptional antiterminator
MSRYPSNRLFEEVAYLAYHFHWAYERIMTFDHRERQRWVTEVAHINERLNSAG